MTERMQKECNMDRIDVKEFAHKVVAFVLHFTHGGLLVAGLIATAFLFANIGRSESLGRGLQGGGMLAERIGYRSAAMTVQVEPDVEIRGVIDYVARKYRVAAAAVEPLLMMAQTTGTRAGIDPLLIVAVMAIESGFNPIAESSMGAQGLMQVIPRFHQDKLDEVSGGSLLDPAANIHVGVLVLKEYIRRTGSLEDGLQMYGGAASDDGGSYAAKVLAEKQRLEAAAGRGRPSNA